MNKGFLFVALGLFLTACTAPQPPRYLLALESDYPDPKARQVLSHLVGPDDMRVRRPGSVVERACHGEAAAIQDIFRVCESADGEHAEVQGYYLARIFFSLGDPRFADSLRFASATTKKFAARHLLPIFHHYHVRSPETRATLEPHE